MIENCSATFSAVIPMWTSSNAHVSPSCTTESTSAVCPMRAPKRAAFARYGARDMLSMPPATTMSASPARIACAASATDFRPEPQSMLIVVAGTCCGMPAASDACRAGFWPSPACSTQPRKTSSTASAARPTRSSAPRMACAASCGAGMSLNAPPNMPMGVRRALTMTG